MLAGGGGDAERLLHQAVCLVSVSLRLSIVLILVATASRVWSFTTTSSVGVEASAALALHLTVCEEASRNPTGTPRLAIRPSSHAGFPLIPDKNRTRSN